MIELPEVLPGHWESDEGAGMAKHYLTMTREQLCDGQRTDMGVAFDIALLDRKDWSFEPRLAAARDRIRWLSAQLAQVKSYEKRFNAASTAFEGSADALEVLINNRRNLLFRHDVEFLTTILNAMRASASASERVRATAGNEESPPAVLPPLDTRSADGWRSSVEFCVQVMDRWVADKTTDDETRQFLKGHPAFIELRELLAGSASAGISTDAGMEVGDLLPCPFCGHRANEPEFYGETKLAMFVSCSRCGASVYHGGKNAAENRAAVITAWNLRAPTSADMRVSGVDGYTADAYKLAEGFIQEAIDADLNENLAGELRDRGYIPITVATKALAKRIVSDRVSLHFQIGDQPDTKIGGIDTFLVMTENSDGKRFVFAAYYLNAHLLNYEDPCDERGCPKDENHDDGCPTTGWFYDESNFEYDNCYHALSGKVLAWARIPKSDVVTAMLAASPTPPTPQGERRDAEARRLINAAFGEYACMIKAKLTETEIAEFEKNFAVDARKFLHGSSEPLKTKPTPEPVVLNGGDGAMLAKQILQTADDQAKGWETNRKGTTENGHRYVRQDIALEAIAEALRRSGPSPAPKDETK